MTSSPVQQAREALGARLREIRTGAGLTGRVLASRCGWHFTKITKLEHGTQTPSEDDLRAWCEACGAAGQLLDLVATMRAVHSMYREWHRLMRAGLKGLQASYNPLYERTKLFRAYENTVIPGLLHTAEYAAAILTWWSEFMQLDTDVDQAVGARLDRQRVLYTGDRRFHFVLEEQALKTRVGDAEVMLGQLDRVLAVMSLPRVSLGIIPATGRRHCLAQGSFWLFDESRVHTEGVSAGLAVTQPTEVTLYARAFALLQQSAVYGPAARQLITAALADLTDPDRASPDQT